MGPEGFMELRPYQHGNDCADYDKEYYTKLGPLANLISGQMGNGAQEMALTMTVTAKLTSAMIEMGSKPGLVFVTRGCRPRCLRIAHYAQSSTTA